MKPALVAAMALAAVACHGSPHPGGMDKPAGSKASSDGSKGDLLDFDLSSGLHDSPNGGFVIPIPASRTYPGLVRELERASKNADAKGIFVRLGDETVDWARAEELGLAFSRLRERGKPIVCHAHSLDNKSTFFFARACSKVWVSPAGDIDTVGIGGQVVYLKGALDKLKIHADFLHMGRYKSAAEALTQEGPSREARESLTAVLSSIRDTWIEGFTTARHGKDMAPLLEDGPWSPPEAKSNGIVDAVGYEDEARREAQSLAHTTHTVVAFGKKHSDGAGIGLAEVFRLIAGADNGTKRPHIAVLPAEGSIAMGAGGLLSDAGITAKAMERVVKRLASDDTVKAVVLRIDSPGGSALASDILWHDLMELRKKKPLIASVGDMAASGGYYLACAATKVVAERTSIVGSIGVVGGKIVFDEALSDVGIHAESFPASGAPGAASRAGYLSPLMPWDDATREKVRAQMAAVYDLFLSRVAEGRAMPIEAVRAVAEGRIWSGVQGLKLKLVDELGGLGRSLDLARKLAKLDDDAPVRVEGVTESLLESLLVGEGADQATLELAFRRLAERRHVVLDRVADDLRPFISSLAPLADGELVLAALPFGLVIR